MILSLEHNSIAGGYVEPHPHVHKVILFRVLTYLVSAPIPLYYILNY